MTNARPRTPRLRRRRGLDERGNVVLDRLVGMALGPVATAPLLGVGRGVAYTFNGLVGYQGYTTQQDGAGVLRDGPARRTIAARMFRT